MARLFIANGELRLHLNWLEKLADLSRRPVSVPVVSIESIEVVKNPHESLLAAEVDFGFAGNGAPARKVMSLKTRAKARTGGRAAVIAYLNRDAVVVRLRANATPWRLLVVTSRHADKLGASLRAASVT